MAVRVIREMNPAGGVTFKYKTGSSGGGFGSNPESVASGSAVTISDDNEVALSGAGDEIHGFLDKANATTGEARILTREAGRIADVITNGTVTVGSRLVGYSDSDRGKAVGLAPSYSGTPTVGELKAANDLIMKARWVVTSSTSGHATVEPL